MAPNHTDRADGNDSSDGPFESRPTGTDDPRTTGTDELTRRAGGTIRLQTNGRSWRALLATVLVAGLLVVAAAGAPSLSAAATATPPTGGTVDAQPAPGADSPLTVAFIGDAGMTDDTREVLNLIDDEGTDVVVYSGDFDYEDDPEGWVEMLDEELGPDTPVVAAIGNHDVERWDDYQRVIDERLARSDAVQCSGDVGWRSTCTVGDLTVVQSGVGMCDYSDPSKAEYIPDRCADADPSTDEAYVADRLADSDTTWQVCSWHLVNGRYQLGDKDSLVPASLYDTCREGGALVATGHDHTYARTYPMADFDAETVADESPPYTVGNGSSFAFVSAAAGQSFYEPTDLVDEPYWDATHTDGAFGAFFCTLRPDGTGECYFKTVDGEVVDGPFEIRRSTADGTTPDTEPTPDPEPTPDAKPTPGPEQTPAPEQTPSPEPTPAPPTENTISLHASPGNSGVVDVSFVVDGEASYGPEAESDTDTIESVADGTRVTSVALDPDAVDSYAVTGPVVDFDLPDGSDVDVTWNGEATTFEALVDDGSEPVPNTSDPLPNTLVVDGRGTDGVAAYTVTVSGDIERDADATSFDGSSPWDWITDISADGEAVGLVGDGVDVYRFSGEVVSQTVEGDADVSVETG